MLKRTLFAIGFSLSLVTPAFATGIGEMVGASEGSTRCAENDNKAAGTTVVIDSTGAPILVGGKDAR